MYYSWILKNILDFLNYDTKLGTGEIFKQQQKTLKISLTEKKGKNCNDIFYSFFGIFLGKVWYLSVRFKMEEM